MSFFFIAEDFDFEFIESTIDSSADEMNEALNMALSDLNEMVKATEPSEDITMQIHS